MSLKTRGILCAAISAAIYGVTPILARLAFDGGANGVTVAFLRGALPLVFLFLIMRKQKISLRPGKDLKMLLLTGVCGVAFTTLLLYISYSYIAVGMATTLHFIYPVLIAVAGVVIFKDKLNLLRVLALLLCSVGIALFMEPGGVSFLGIALALLSGATYTLFMLCVEKTNLRNIHYFKLTFYVNVCIAVVSGVFGLATGQLNLALTPSAWIFCAILALSLAFAALPLLRQGIKLTSASTVSILSTLEPIVGVGLGILVLGESFSLLKLVGAAAIILSILLITISEREKTLALPKAMALPKDFALPGWSYIKGKLAFPQGTQLERMTLLQRLRPKKEPESALKEESKAA